MLFIFSFSEPETIRYKYRSNVSCSYYLIALARRFCKIFTSRTSRQKRENGATQRENALIITPHRSSPLSPSRIRCERQEREREIFFNSRSRTQVGVANECEFYIVDPRAGGVYERINFIPLFPWGCMRKCQLYIATASPDIICDIGAFPRRDRIRIDRERGRSGRQIRAYARDIEGVFTRVVWRDSHGNLHKSTMHSKFAS